MHTIPTQQTNKEAQGLYDVYENNYLCICIYAYHQYICVYTAYACVCISLVCSGHESTEKRTENTLIICRLSM